VLFLLGIGVATAAEVDVTKEELVRELTELLPPDTVTGTRVASLHGFRVEASHVKQLGQELQPNGVEFDAVTIEAPSRFKAVVTKESAPSVGGGVAIFHRDTGTPLLDTADNDGDGGLDVLSYSVVDTSGQVVVQITDYEADGQPDLRINFAQKYFEIWHRDRWHRVETREGKRGITIDGTFIELRQEKNRWVVP
jgi:hypothetical protein